MNRETSRPEGDAAPADETGEILARAIEFHREGRLQEAEAGYREVLRRRPQEPTSLHMLGVLAYQAGRYDRSIALIEQARRHAPGDAGLHTNLGSALQAAGRLDEAVASYQRALGINPDFALACNNLGNALRLQGRMDESVAAFRRALEIDPGYTDAWVNLAVTEQAREQPEEAARCYQRALELDPAHGPARHMLAALRGEQTRAAPAEHVAHLFDEYASRFDRHLVDTLGYSMPALLRAEIDRLTDAAAAFDNAIDLGCGTGLAGVAFRPLVRRLSGVDLSARMIDKARERGVYDHLRTGDIVSALQETDESYDLFLCADVFPYIGDVEPLFSALGARSRDNALFAFSTEHQKEGDYRLRPTGRYAHAPDYLRKMAGEHGFEVRSLRTENLRKHRERWIEGDLVVLQYRG